MAAPISVAARRHRPALATAALGLGSGLLSSLIGLDLELAWLKPVAAFFFLDAGAVPIGLLFAAAIALGVWLRTGNVLALPVLLVTTVYAWSAALQVAIRFQRNIDDDPHLIAASLCAGAAGAGLTHLGCAIFVPGLRRPARIAATCIVGAMAGLLLFLGQRKLADERLLFVLWQPAVAFSIGLGLTDRRQQG